MIEKEKVKHVAELARLQLKEEEIANYSEQISKILDYFQQIEEVETKGVEPLVTPTEIESFWREDRIHKDTSVEEVIQNAPENQGNLFRVPPVV